MTRNMKKSRRGFTLIELMVGIVIFAIIGALFTKLLTVQGKFFDRQGMGNAARNVSRASLNRVVSDFRMIEATGGVIAASPTSLTLRIPFAIGVWLWIKAARQRALNAEAWKRIDEATKDW